jgi:hypothetical protein
LGMAGRPSGVGIDCGAPRMIHPAREIKFRAW